MATEPFSRAQEEFLRLKGKLAVGRISPAEFETALQRLTIQDAQGRYWRIASESGAWLVYNGQQWVLAAPPSSGRPFTSPTPPLAQRRAISTRIIAIAGVAVVILVVLLLAGIAASQGLIQIASANTPTSAPTNTSLPPMTVAPAFQPTLTPIPVSAILPTSPATLPPSQTPARPTSTSAPTSTPTVTATFTPAHRPFPTGQVPLPANLVLKHDEGVSQAELDLIQKSAALAYDYLGDAGQVYVLAYKDLDSLIAEFARLKGVPKDSPDMVASRNSFSNMQADAMGERPAILIWTEGSWKTLTAESKSMTLAHEYAHVVQSFLSQKASLTFASALWMTEGSARYLEYRFGDMYGLYSWAEGRQRLITGARGYRDPLVASEGLVASNREGGSSKYYLGFHAVELLVNSFGEEAVLRRYWQAVSTAGSWREAFQSTFGLSTDEFYRQYEEYRLAQFPPLCGPVRAEPEDALAGPLAVQFNSQQAPGYIVYTNSYSRPPNVPYLFCVKGVDLIATQDLEKKLSLPEGFAGVKTPSGSLLVLYMNPSSPSKITTLKLDLGQGRVAQAQFMVGPSSAGALPSPVPVPSLVRKPAPAATPTATIPAALAKTKIVFGSNIGGDTEIWVMNADGSQVTKLTDNDAIDSHPRWSADGTRIVFASNREGNYEIYAMNSDGSGVMRLTNNPAYDHCPDYSPDSKKIAFYSTRENNRAQIYVMDTIGMQQTRLTNSAGNNYCPRWSPDGKRILFYSTRDGAYGVYAMNADGSSQVRIGKADSASYPNWSPDGAYITFTSYSEGRSAISIMKADGTDEKRLTNGWGFDSYPCWSPDGQWIIFQSDREIQTDLFAIRPDGSQLLRLTNRAGQNLLAAWGPLLAPK